MEEKYRIKVIEKKGRRAVIYTMITLAVLFLLITAFEGLGLAVRLSPHFAGVVVGITIWYCIDELKKE